LNWEKEAKQIINLTNSSIYYSANVWDNILKELSEDILKKVEQKVAKVCKKAIRDKWDQYDELDTDIVPGSELYCIAIDEALK
jgi:ribosomal protein L18E